MRSTPQLHTDFQMSLGDEAQPLQAVDSCGIVEFQALSEFLKYPKFLAAMVYMQQNVQCTLG